MKPMSIITDIYKSKYMLNTVLLMSLTVNYINCLSGLRIFIKGL